MADIWNAVQYMQFSDHRTRPALDLLMHIHIDNPGLIYDLGCGTGNITQLLEEHWPKANIIGIDNSDSMLSLARKLNSKIDWVQADLSTSRFSKPADLIFSNSTLHWLQNHEKLFPYLAKNLNQNGVLAIQMPNNFQAPSHECIIEVAKNQRWQKKLLPILIFDTAKLLPVHEPQFYYNALAPILQNIDIWETEYLQILQGENPILEWMKGTSLRPILHALDEVERTEFLNEYAELLNQYYPQDRHGNTLFPFKRLFILGNR